MGIGDRQRDGPALEQLPVRSVGRPGALQVRRSLPGRDRRTVGAWCLVDLFGSVAPREAALDVPPHPHTGLQTLTWLVEGVVEHRDSLGGHVVGAPGQLHLLTSGRGVSHSARSAGDGTLLGVRLWVALPGPDRDCAPRVAHHGELPHLRQPGAEVRVLVGSYAGVTSPAVVHTPLVALQVALDRTTVLELDPSYEHAVLLLTGTAEVEGEPLRRGGLLYVGSRREALALAGDRGSRLLVIGGTPFEEELVLWWNFAGRSHSGIVEAREQWQLRDERFGTVAGDPRGRLPAPALPAVRLRARPRVRS